MERGIFTRYTRKDGHLADVVGQIPIFAVASVLFASCMAILINHGIPVGPDLTIANSAFYLKSIGLLMIVDSTLMLVRLRPDRPTAYLLNRYTNAAIRARFMARIPLLAVIVGFMPVFSNMEPMIPLFHPYNWDTTL